ncbi:MAG: hypothetical protein LBF28_01250 [Rickettsiales bacterium]|nr:hypothetical protein [Rickettsiales bacterium]
MTVKRTNDEELWNKLFLENHEIQSQQSRLMKNLEENSEDMLKIIFETANNMAPKFYKDESSVKIKISSFYELYLMAYLAKSNPVKFVEKCLHQYMPKVVTIEEYRKYKDNFFTPMFKESLLASHYRNYNFAYKDFNMVCPAMLISAGKRDGDPYDRDWYEGDINLYFGRNECKVIKYEEKGKIYLLLDSYCERNIRSK